METVEKPVSPPGAFIRRISGRWRDSGQPGGQVKRLFSSPQASEKRVVECEKGGGKSGRVSRPLSTVPGGQVGKNRWMSGESRWNTGGFSRMDAPARRAGESLWKTRNASLYVVIYFYLGI